MQRFVRGTIAAAWIAAMFVMPAAAARLAQDSQALITSPTDGQAVSGLVPIFGTAAASDFSRYEIAFAPDPDPGDAWQTFATADIVLTNAQIGLWDANLPPGTYALRLSVFRSDGSLAAEDFVNGLIVGPPPTETPDATPTGVPPAPTFEPETQTTVQPTIVIEQPPTATPAPAIAGGGVDAGASSRRGADSAINLSRFVSAFADGVSCAFGGFLLLGAVWLGRWGLRWFMKQMRERSN